MRGVDDHFSPWVASSCSYPPQNAHACDGTDEGYLGAVTDGLSRRTFGQIATGVGVLGAGALAGACAREHHTAPATAPAVTKGVGITLSYEQFRTDQLVLQAQAAEKAGFQYVWACDHIQPWQDNEGHSMFPWLTLALVGNATSRISFGTGVTCPTYRYHPATVAQAFASLAMLSPGRVFLGVGTRRAAQ